MKKTLIYTTLFTGNQKYIDLFYDWIFSIRTLGQYNGEILIGDYGVDQSIIDNLKYLENTKIVKLPNRNKQTISNYRNVDMIPILEEYDDDYKFVHFDVDIWFQDEINSLFDKLDDIDGCYFGLEQRRLCRWRGPEKEEIIQKYNNIQTELNGFVFGGWIAGKKKPYIEKLKLMKKTFESDGWTYNEWGTDQCMITYLFDKEKDNSTGDKWGKSYYFCEIEDNKWQITDEFTKQFNISNKVHGIHLVIYSGQENKNYRFIDMYKNLFDNEWKKMK